MRLKQKVSCLIKLPLCLHNDKATGWKTWVRFPAGTRAFFFYPPPSRPALKPPTQPPIQPIPGLFLQE